MITKSPAQLIPKKRIEVHGAVLVPVVSSLSYTSFLLSCMEKKRQPYRDDNGSPHSNSWYARSVLRKSHSTMEAEAMVNGGLLLGVLLQKDAAILKLLASKDSASADLGDSLLTLMLSIVSKLSTSVL
ncbi:hypothetical protein K7X08_005456 [Anisodus acutangulus]|uniref:Uncharacterized protein n=1 Tax=Anisodus acutangulus TaxID=402998 RepID=A0A9Q1LUK2_9SOLA|nr:hypothetical protein K7X08_005456 [Anisodus acutangulus]